MIKIVTKLKSQNENGWIFSVRVGEKGKDTNHIVGVSKGHYKKLTNGEIDPEDLIKKSFVFLLDRESQDVILKKFNLMEILRYFPEYEKKVMN